MARFEQELQEGHQRLEELRAAGIPPPVASGSTDHATRPTDLASEVNELRALIQELIQERDSLLAGHPQA